MALTHYSGGSVVLTAAGFAVGAVLMLVFAVINVLGVRRLSDSNTVAVLWKLAVPILCVVVLMVTAFHTSNFHRGSAGGFAPFGFKGILTALPLGVVFALTGFEQAVQLGGESRNPGRDLPPAVIGSVLIGIVLYFMLEVAFLGSLSPSALLHGWTHPIGKGDFGPFATIATGLGLGWLAVLLYSDAVVSPGGTGLVYVGTSSRVAYTLSRGGFAPRALSRLDNRGVPVVSILLSFVVGIVMFLPFPGWQKLVEFISSASALMLAFAPLSLAVLRKSDGGRERPYRFPAAGLLAPTAFAAASLIVYWSGWTTVWKLLIAVAIGYAVLVTTQLVSHRLPREDLDLTTLVWLLPYLVGLGVLSRLGQFGGGTKTLPFGLDMVVVAVFALVVFAVALRHGAPSGTVQRYVDEESGAQADA